MATIETAWRKTDGAACYYAGKVAIELGDRVECRGLFRTRRGCVNYVPGISAVHPEMEHGGLYWVGVSFDNGTFSGILIDPDTGCAQKKLRFVERGKPGNVPPLPADGEW